MTQYDTLMEASRRAGPFYAATPFWEVGARRLLEALDAEGIENFRNRGAPLNFFVPTYGYPGNSLSEAQIAALHAAAAGFAPKQAAMVDMWLSGQSHALADYRAFAAAARAGGGRRLLGFSESKVGNPVEHFEFDGRSYSRSALNYLAGLVFLAEHADLDTIGTVLEIGGGFGTLGEIMAQCWPADRLRYIDVDIPPTCQFADHYLSNACPNLDVKQSGSAVAPQEMAIDALPPLSVLPNWQIENLQGHVDLFVNFISFQEMEPDVVQNYLTHVDRLGARWVLLRNMREGKQKRTSPDGVGVDQPILIEAYAQMLPNYTQVASETTVFGYRTSDGFHSDLILLRRNG